MKLSEEITVDDAADVVTICGICYAGQFFRGFGELLAKGDTFRFETRENGAVHITTLPKNVAPGAAQ